MNCERKGRRISAPQVAATLIVLALGLLAAPAAEAAKPSVIAFGAQPAPGAAEVILGEVNPGGEQTDFFVAYGLASSHWCAEQPSVRQPSLALALELELGLRVGQTELSGHIGGFGGLPPHSTPPTALGYSDEEDHAVAVELGELDPGDEYCAELVAFNAFGSATSTKIVFTVGAPQISASHYVAADNTLQAEVDPAGEATEYLVQYAPIASEWCSSQGARGTPAQLGAPTPLGFSDNDFHPVSVRLAGLVAGAEYCAALYASNESGTAAGFQVSFAERPTVESLSPPSGLVAGGETVTITGENLAGASAVHFGSSDASILSVAPDEVVVSSPAHELGTVDVTVTTPAGTSATSENDLYVYRQGPEGAPVQPPPQGPTGPTGTIGSTGATGSTGSTGSSGPPPVVGKSEQVGVVEEPVTVKLPGPGAFVALTGGATIPDGSEIDATHGSVVVTVLTPDGHTVSAELHGGRFRIHQDRNGETHFILTLALTGCPPAKLPRGAAAAARSRRKRPKARYLWVTEKGGHWGTNGRYVSTSVEGTTWLTLDECGRSVVLVTEGRVRVRNLVTGRTRTVRAGGRYRARARRPKHRQHP